MGLFHPIQDSDGPEWTRRGGDGVQYRHQVAALRSLSCITCSYSMRWIGGEYMRISAGVPGSSIPPAFTTTQLIGEAISSFINHTGWRERMQFKVRK